MRQHSPSRIAAPPIRCGDVRAKEKSEEREVRHNEKKGRAQPVDEEVRARVTWPRMRSRMTKKK